MSRNFTVLEKTSSENSLPPFGVQPAHDPLLRNSEYAELVQRLFTASSVVAMIAAGTSAGAASVCEGVATELSHSGKRVVMVAVQELLRVSPPTPPDETTFQPGHTRQVWRWPFPASQQIEFFKPRTHAADGENWLDSLRRNFDSILLDCPSVEALPGGAAVAAQADAAVLVVEAARSSKQQVLRDQRTLQLSGVKLVGCVLMQRR